MRAKKVYPPELIAALRTVGDDRYWTIVYDGPDRCPNCECQKGTDWAGFWAAVGEKCGWYSTAGHDYERESRFYPCPVCRSADAHYQVQRSLRTVSGLTPDDLMLHLNTVYKIPGQEDMLRAVGAFLHKWTEGIPSGWLTLVGAYGSGKTTAGKVLVKHLLEAGIEAQYGVCDELYERIKATYEGNSSGQRDFYLLRQWATIPVFVFDQVDWLSPKQPSGDALHKFRMLLNMRYESRGHVGTVLIVNSDWFNHPPLEMEPIRRRMNEGVIVEATCGDVSEYVKGLREREGVPA